MGPGLDFGAVAGSQGFSCNAANPLVCTLPAGTAPGTYTVDYTAKVNAQAKGSVSNAVLGGGPGTTTCTSNCSTTTPVLAAVVTYRKQSSTVAPVGVGDAVDYSVEVTVANSQTTDTLVLTDTLGVGLDLQSVTQPGPFTCNASNPLVCSLPAGTAPGTYTLGYRALVNAQASGTATAAPSTRLQNRASCWRSRPARPVAPRCVLATGCAIPWSPRSSARPCASRCSWWTRPMPD
ncbi:hypothetical protein G6F23_013237 [Rhizopus arrhizus]|nr:hypothetical protein G6F23_013237 [Rhizopus arrhizus]